MNSQKKQVLKAIQKLGNKVTAADVVARSGCSLQISSHLLTEIASETAATLHVNNHGEILYQFRPNFQYIYLSRGTVRLLGRVFNKIIPLFMFLFKISFGLILVLSVTVIFGTVLIIRSLLSVGIDSGSSVPAMWMDFISAFRQIVWLDFGKNRESKARIAATSMTTPAAADPLSSQGFLLDCYSFLFGPGNPNEGIEDERSKLIAQTIRLNEGVVLAEHFAPYTGRPPEDEQALFSILARFNGQPVVSDSGDILYLFPSIGGKGLTFPFALASTCSSSFLFMVI